MTATHWLIDGGALSDAQWALVTQAPTCQPLYAFLHDEAAARMGPVLVPDGEAARTLASSLKADVARCWAISELRAQVSTQALGRHLAQLAHCWTADGQRFFWRFADGRSMRMVWSALTLVQQLRVLGPVQTWCTTDRSGQALPLTAPSARHAADPGAGAGWRLTLNDAQFEHVLAQSWPDHLLAAVLDEAPDLSSGIGAEQLHALAQQACAWLQARGEERHAPQKASLAHVLRHGRGQWTEPPQPSQGHERWSALENT